jgi:hypothetical protein
MTIVDSLDTMLIMGLNDGKFQAFVQKYYEICLNIAIFRVFRIAQLG